MAIIGNVYKLKQFFKNKELDIVFEYFQEALDEESVIYKRIFALPVGAFERVNVNDKIFALEQVFYTKNRLDCFIESHKKYIDFQLILSGTEQMEYIDIDKLEVDKSYDIQKDLITYKIVDYTSKILLQQYDLAIFFPDDAHIGLPEFQRSEIVYKTVVKFPIELWEKNEF